MNIDITRLMAVRPPKHFNNCLVADTDPLGKGTIPREIEIVLPNADGSKVLAMWHGYPSVAVNDYVRVRRDGTDTNILVVEGAGGSTGAGAGGGVWPKPGKINIGDVEYDTIQAAINAAASGAIIKIGEGEYTENLVISQYVKIMAWPRTVVINTDGAKGIDATAAYLEWDGPDVNHSSLVSTNHAMYLGLGGYIKNCTITNDYGGSYAYGITTDISASLSYVVANCSGGSVETFAVWLKSGYLTIRGGVFLAGVTPQDLKLDGSGATLYEFPTFRGYSGAATVTGWSYQPGEGLKAHTGFLTLPSGNAVNNIVTTLGDPGSNSALATEAAIRAAIAAGGGGGVWPKADKATIDATEYSTIAALMAALTSGAIGRVGEGSYTSDGQTLPAGAMLEGSGIGVTTLTTGSNDKVLTVSGGPVRNLTLTNTRATGTKYGLYSNSGSADLYNLRAALTAAGDNNYGFAFAFGGSTYNLYNCQANVSGASTFNYALFNDRCAVNVHQPVFTGNVYTFGASTVNIYGGVITGNLEADGASAVIRLHNLPTITGTLTLTSGGTITGWYRDSSGIIQKAGSVYVASDIIPPGNTVGLNTRFENLFGTDKPKNIHSLTLRNFYQDNFAGHIAGFHQSSASPYPVSAPFSLNVPANCSADSTTHRHHLSLFNFTGASTNDLYLQWSSASTKPVSQFVLALSPWTYSLDYLLAEYRIWADATPISTSRWWSIRWGWYGVSSPQHPLQLGVWNSAAAGDGLTYALTTGTQIGMKAPITAGADYNYLMSLSAGPTLNFNFSFTNGKMAGNNGATVASMPTTHRTARLTLHQTWCKLHVDEMFLS